MPDCFSPRVRRLMLARRVEWLALDRRIAAFVIDAAKVAADARHDGTVVARSNTTLAPLLVMMRYRDLWRVEELFRRTKPLLRPRPIDHASDEAIRGLVVCSFLALLLPDELYRRSDGFAPAWDEVVAISIGCSGRRSPTTARLGECALTPQATSPASCAPAASPSRSGCNSAVRRTPDQRQLAPTAPRAATPTPSRLTAPSRHTPARGANAREPQHSFPTQTTTRQHELSKAGLAFLAEPSAPTARRATFPI